MPPCVLSRRTVPGGTVTGDGGIMRASAVQATVSSDSDRGESHRWILWPLAVYVGTRLADAVLLLLAGRDQGDRFAVGSYDYFGLIQNWDGGWFGDIARHGYP